MFRIVFIVQAFFILLNFCVSSVSSVDATFYGQDIWKDAASMCPYNNFCTINATKHQSPDDEFRTPCCQKCSCDIDCQKYGVCCPDLPHRPWAEIEYPCVDLVNDCNNPRGIEVNGRFDVNFHVVDRCPNSTIADEYTACQTRTSNIWDYIVVTDIITGRVYKNSHCAHCNGVEQFTEWDIVTECHQINQVQFETFEERDAFIVSHCGITPVPPDALMSSLYRCHIDTMFDIHACFKDTLVDSDIKKACETDTPNANAMFTAQRHMGMHTNMYITTNHYKNIFCFMCSLDAMKTKQPDLCDQHPFFALRSSNIKVGMLMLLKYTEPRVDVPNTHRCNTSSIWDVYSKSCLKLSCPASSIPYHGECRHVSDGSAGVAFDMVYSLEMQTPVYIVDSLEILDGGITQAFGNSIVCGRCTTRIGRGTNTSNYYIFYSLHTHAKCSRDFLLSRIQSVFKHSITVLVPSNTSQYASHLFTLAPSHLVTLTPNTAVHESITMIKSVRSLPLCPLSIPITPSILQNCARVDTRNVPFKLDLTNGSSAIAEKMINETLCVRDYFMYMDSLYNKQASNRDMIQWCNLWLVMCFIKHIYSML